MKNRSLFFALVLLATSAGAQTIYNAEDFGQTDLNGTARFVGMGGALGALGADISTMSVNPAGIGLFRKSDISLGFSLNNQIGAEDFSGHGPTKLSFDQIGFVYSANMNTSGNAVKYVNFGFNYSKSKNFNQLLSSNQSFSADGPSQTMQMADLANYWGLEDYAVPIANAGCFTSLINSSADDENTMDYYTADRNSYRRERSGGINRYDFNVSMNINEQIYLGLTMGISDIDYSSYSLYGESLNQNLGGGNYVHDADYTLSENKNISGSGFDIKLGAIIRPFEYSPFRIGLSVSTPTWYNLESRSYSLLYAKFVNYEDSQLSTDVVSSYNISTPWKFNFSLGTTIGRSFAIGAEYEYQSLGSTKFSYSDSYDSWGYSNESNDDALNHEASKWLKGISTFRIGAEQKLNNNFSIRLGYNYVSSPMKKNAYLNEFINSISIDYAVGTEYMNLSDINRITCGIGYRWKNIYADLSYLYQHQTGDFYAFNTQYGGITNSETNLEYLQELPASKIKLNRQQFLLTLGYKF